MTRLRALLVALAASCAVIIAGGAQRASAVITNATFDEPVDQATYAVPRMPLSGTFTVDAGDRQITVTAKRDVSGATPAVFSVKETQLDTNGHYAVETSPDFAYNGRYLVNADYVNHDNRPITGCNNGLCEQQFSRTVFLAAPPAPPTGLNTAYDAKARTVTVTWDNAPEPDTQGWVVRRSVNGGPQGPENSVVASKNPPAYLDKSLPDAGAKLEYFVTAIRTGATDKSTVRSDPSSKAVIVEPKPVDTPTTTVPKGGPTTTMSPFGPTVTAPPTTVKGRPKVVGSLGDFAKGLTPGVTRSTLADGTYDPTLPYGPGNELEPGTDEAQRVFAPTPGTDTGLPAVFYVAAAMLTAVIAAHVLYVLRQAKNLDPALEEIPLDLLPIGEAVAVPIVKRQPRVAKRIARVADSPSPRQPRVAKRVPRSTEAPVAPKRTPRRVR